MAKIVFVLASVKYREASRLTTYLYNVRVLRTVCDVPEHAELEDRSARGEPMVKQIGWEIHDYQICWLNECSTHKDNHV